ncbi:MAG: CPBP family intramembrane metalloprotease [Bacteroidales bacterium]|nr:CPBP family intramembrane metalloprotease [Bacteroidales bacterium]
MKKAIRYSIVVCIVSWMFAAFMIFGLNVKNILDNPMMYTICASLYMLLPLITAVVIQKIDKEKLASTSLFGFKINWAWLVAWILPVVIVLSTILVNMLMPGCEFNADLSSTIPADSVPEEQKELFTLFMNPTIMIVVTIVSGLFAGVTINAVFAFGEEYGWRNYLIAALKEKKFVCASIFIGIIWGIWHFPLILLGHNYPQHSVAGVFMMVVFCVLASFVETYFVLKTKSVFTAAIFHGTINAVAGLNVLVIKGGNDLLNGLTGLSGFFVMAIVIAIIYVFDKYVLKDNIFTKTIGEALENGERQG